MDRRSFIKLTAVSGATAAVSGCSVPDASLIRFVPDEDIMPGQATWKPGVCTLCAAGCGLTVRVMDADADVVRDGQKGLKRILAAKKLEGGPEHPVNHGRLCARGQAGIQVTYHPDRITQPLKRTGDRGTGQYAPISWDDAIAELTQRIDALTVKTGEQPALAWLGRADSGHRSAFIARFVRRLGGTGPIGFDVFGDEVLRRANAMSFGRPQLPSFDLARTRYVLSLGADFLGTWNSPVAQSVGYGAMRRGRRGIRGTFVQVESRMTQTGANADEWVPANPGTEGALALGLAHVILKDGSAPARAAGRAGACIEGWADGLPGSSPEAVSAITGVAAARIERLARELTDGQPAVVIVGGPPLAHSNGLFTALAVNALDALLGAVDRPGGLYFTPQANVAAMAGLEEHETLPTPSLRAFVAERLDGAATVPGLVIVDGVNPVYGAPPAWQLRDGLMRVPAIVSVGQFLDETSILADLILPDHSFLESWTDAVLESGAPSGVISMAPPVMRPLHDTRSTVDVLLEVSTRLQRPLRWPWPTHEALLMASLSTLPPATPDGDTWSEVQERGGWWGALPPALVRVPAPVPPPVASTFVAPILDGDPEQFPLNFLPYASSTFLDGSLAHLPWLQEMPDPLTSAMWSTWVEINPSTAAALGIADGDVVRVTSAHGALEVAAILSPGISPSLVAMPAGQGHTTFTRYASGRGANPLSILAPMTEPATGALAWAATRVKVERVGGPDGRLILFAGGTREYSAHDHPPHR
jgi:anaerobic selenocysteine-containing dehydrogenase